MCAWGGPKVVNVDQKVQCVAVSAKHLHQFELEGNIFLEQIVMCDETWVHYFTLKLELSSI
jgi:hypothetical protein